MRLLAAGLFTALLGLTACASTPPQVTVLTSAPPPSEATLEAAPSRVAAFEALPGWSADDHLAALSAFRTACGLALGDTLGVVCERARRLASPSQTTARQFLEANFRPEAVEGEGLLTAYFAPEYEARDRPGSAFTAPVRPRPVDLVDDVSDGAYPDRSQIEARPSTDALAWMRPEDLFFLQIQGSGSLTFPDGRRLNAVYAAHNGRRFSGIATAMRDRGLLADNNTSGSAIHAWLAGHRGDEATAIMRLNPRYVFFRLEPDTGGQPAGAAGAPLPPGRAIAVDLSQHPLGELFWIDARAPALVGAFPTYQRLVVALDTGGAIRGTVRADLYTGRGAAAGIEAGRVRHVLRLYRLVPLAP